jgi:16S rRNA processing protein RimM
VDHSEWIPVGRLRRTRGRRGELIGEIYSNRPGRASALRRVALEAEGRRVESVVEDLWYHDGSPVFKFAGIDSISEAERWEGADILVPPEDQAVPEEGEYRHADLIGCTVLDESGARLGVVSGVEDYGASPLLNVTAAEGKELLIPFAKAICIEIDVPGKMIRVKLPEGLADL